MMEITGPIDCRQQAAWDEIKADLAMFDGLVKDAAEEVEADPADDEAQRDLKFYKALMRKFEALVPAGWNWREIIEIPGCVTKREDAQVRTAAA